MISIVLVCILSLGLIGCGNNLVSKSIENAKVSMENKEYDKALISLELALDEEPESGEANKLYRILEKYIESKELVDNDKFHEAEEVLAKLDTPLFEGLSIEEDINNLKEAINKHKEEEKTEEENKKQEEETKKQEELAKQESEKQTSEVTMQIQEQVIQEEQKVCFICNQTDYVSNLNEVHGYGLAHLSCYESAPVCSICHQTKLIWNEDANGNGICDYKCDKLCTNCWTNPKNGGASGLCDECEWNKYYSNKATCGGCIGNIVDGSLAGTICPDCGYEFKLIN